MSDALGEEIARRLDDFVVFRDSRPVLRRCEMTLTPREFAALKEHLGPERLDDPPDYAKAARVVGMYRGIFLFVEDA